MALLLNDGSYLKLKLDEVRLLSNVFTYNTYASQSDRDVEKLSGSLPPFHTVIGGQATCPSYNLSSPLAGTKPASDELATLIYTALRTDRFPDSVDA